MTPIMLLRVRGGLCNRLQGLLSGALWAAQAGRSFRVAWPVDESFGADLSHLFIHDYQMIHPIAVKAAARLCGGYQTHQDVRLNDSRKVIVAVSGKQFLSNGTPIPIRGELQRLRPVADIAARVMSTATWRQPVVGVMIRANRHAHPETAALSPLEWFLTRMHAIRKDNSDIPFFLSTDSFEVSAAIHGTFDGVIELSGKSPFNTAAGLSDAVADLYLLASTTYILGSAVSSFSDTAALLAQHKGYETSQHEAEESWESRRGQTVGCVLEL